MQGRSVDRRISVLLAAIATYVFIQTRSYPPSLVPSSPGPGLFPSLLAVTLLILAALLWVNSPPSPRTTQQASNRPIAGPLIAVGIIVAFTAVLEHTDLFLTLPLLLAAVMWIMGERRTLSLVLTPLLFDVFVYVVFYRAFGVAFPTVFF